MKTESCVEVVFVAVAPGVWGRGESEADALKQCRKAGSKAKDKTIIYRNVRPAGSEKPYVDGGGAVGFHGELWIVAEYINGKRAERHENRTPERPEAPAEKAPVRGYTENELAILRAAFVSMKGNGFDFGFIDDCRTEGKTPTQCGATMRVLRKKLPAFSVENETRQLYVNDWKGPQPNSADTFETWLEAVERASV